MFAAMGKTGGIQKDVLVAGWETSNRNVPNFTFTLSLNNLLHRHYQFLRI